MGKVKKSILFVIDSLHCAGAEKSLITLLSLIDYTRFDVSLQLIGYGGALEKLIPKEVKLLKSFSYMQFTELSFKKGIDWALKNHKFSYVWARMKYSWAIRKKQCFNPEKARIWWQSNAKVIEENPIEYDYAISYAQGVPTFYVVDKVKAKKKFAWVNVSYRLQGEDRTFQRRYYEQYKKIVTVSQSAREVFLETFPEFKKKIEVIYDINSSSFITQMANLEGGYNDKFNGIRILTIGRLAHQKGYEMAIESCKQLKERGVNFRWYALGIGPLKEKIQSYIKQNHLEDTFILLGVDPNPYPYIKQCDIYVQTSRYEGFGLAIAEARMLNKPVVTTNFDAVYNQMVQEKNGLVVDMNAEAITEGIIRMIEDHKLKQEIMDYLMTEKKGNEEEIEKFYTLLNA